jgi:alpha-glucosidase
VPFEKLQDPYGKAFWPNFKGRDGCRTPMPWSGDGANAGFSAGEPWLPVPVAHRALSVEAQQHDPDSVLSATRAFLRWRKAQPALVRGSIAFVDAPADVLAFIREADGQRLLVAFNLSDAPLAWPAFAGASLLDAPGASAATLDAGTLHLPPRGAAFATLA